MFPNILRGWSYRQPPPRSVELNRSSPQAKGLLIWTPFSRVYQRSFGVLKNYTKRTGDSTYFGSPSWKYDPIIGPYIALPTTSAGFDWGNIPQVEGINQITVSAWARKNPGYANWDQDMIWAKHTSGTNGCFYFSTTSSNNLRFAVINASSSRVDNDATMSMDPGIWYLLTGVYNGIDLRVYINGLLSSTPSAQTGLIKAHSSTLRFGDFNGGGWDLEGDIAEPRIYDRALSAGEVWAMYDPATRWDLYKPITSNIYYKEEAEASFSQPVYLAGGVDASDFQSAFLSGSSTEVSSQSAYLKGSFTATTSVPAFIQVGESSSVPAFMQSGEEAEDSTDAYTKGEDSDLDSQAAFLAGGIVVTDTQPAFSQGGVVASDTQSAFTTGIVRSSQPAYLEGSSEASSQPAYLKGSDSTSGSQTAYLAGNLQNTIDVQISVDIDDSYTYDGVAVDGENKVLCNEADATTLFSGLRFRDLPIPEQVTIISAYISLWTYSASYWTPEFTLYGEDTNVPTAPEGGTLLDDRTLTTASKLWSEGIVSGWTDSPDLSEIVQEVVDLPAWSAGDDICIIGEDTQSSKKYAAWDYQGNSSRAAKLHIEYVVGVSDNQSAFTKGSAAQSSSQPAFLFGLASSSVPAFLDGFPATPASDSQDAYLAGQSRFVSAFTGGGGPWPFTDDFTGADEDPWDNGKWISTDKL